MPALGASPGAIRRAEARPAPRVGGYTPAPRPQVPNYVEIHAPRPTYTPAPRPSWRGFPTSQPFARGEAQMQRHVERAQANLPKQPTPYIPRLANPTPAQTHAALALIHSWMRNATGGMNGYTRQAFMQEMANDPRQRDFLQTIAHYTTAAQRNLAEQEGARYLLGPAQRPDIFGLVGNAAESLGLVRPTPIPSRAQIPGMLRQLGEALKAQAPISPTAGPRAAPYGGDPVMGLIAAAANLAPAGASWQAANELLDVPGQIALAGTDVIGAAAQSILKRETAPIARQEQQLKRVVEHPAQAFAEAPISTALMALGGENVLGRAAGKLTGYDAGAYRPDILLYGEPGSAEAAAGAGAGMPAYEGLPRPGVGVRITQRPVNPDPLREAIARFIERQRFAPSETVPGALQARGAQVKKLLAGGWVTPGIGDYAASGIERTRRGMVRGVLDAGEGLKPKLGADAVGPMIENTIRSHVNGAPATPETVQADIEGLLDEWKRANKARDDAGKLKLVGEDRAVNEANIARMEGLLKDRRFMQGGYHEAFAVADLFKELQKPSLATRILGRVLNPEQIRAGLFPYAQRFMGAKWHTADMHAEAEQEALARGEGQARADEVSGRSLPMLHEHRAATEQLATAKDNLSKAQDELDRAQKRYDKRVSLNQSARARAGNRPATAAEKRLMAEAKDARQQAKQIVRERKAEHRDAKATLDENPLPPRVAAVRGPHGEQLPTDVILEHMEDHGLAPPGFVSHERAAGSRASYYKRIIGGHTPVAAHPRTGAAFEKGLVDYSWPGLMGTLAKHASEAAQLEGRWRVFRRLSFGMHDTKLASDQAIHNFHADEAGAALAHDKALGPLRTIHVGSGQVATSELAAENQPAMVEHVLEQLGLQEHTTAASRELGKFTAIPSNLHDRLLAHEEALTSKGLMRVIQHYQQIWRRAKLNTSMPHNFGVLQEQAIRLLTEGAGPMDRAVGALWDRNLKALAGLDKNGYLVSENGPNGRYFRGIEAIVGGRGGLVHSQRWTDIYTKADRQLETAGPGYLNGTGTGLVKGAAKPVKAAWDGYRLPLERGLSAAEKAAYHAHLGAQLRASGLVPSIFEFLKMQDAGVQALIKGTMDENTADALARKVDEAMGNWTHNTPLVRKAVGTVFPFGLWWLNSIRWLYKLPLSHPIKTGIAAAIFYMTKPQREAEGQGTGAPHPVPGFLQGSIDPEKSLGISLPFISKGTRVAPTYYSPGGTLGTDAPVTLAQQVVPYLSEPALSLLGVSGLTQEKLRGPTGAELGPYSKFLNALTSLITGPLPFSQQAQSLLQRGGKPYGTANLLTDIVAELGGPATVKPGTQRSISETLAKSFAPTRTVRPGKVKGAGPAPGSTEARQEQLYKGFSGGSEAAQEKRQEALYKGYTGSANIPNAFPTGAPERGVTGKELRFQRNTRFGRAGAMLPYPGGRDWQRYEAPRLALPINPNEALGEGRRTEPIPTRARPRIGQGVFYPRRRRVLAV